MSEISNLSYLGLHKMFLFFLLRKTFFVYISTINIGIFKIVFPFLMILRICIFYQLATYYQFVVYLYFQYLIQKLFSHDFCLEKIYLNKNLSNYSNFLYLYLQYYFCPKYTLCLFYINLQVLKFLNIFFIKIYCIFMIKGFFYSFSKKIFLKSSFFNLNNFLINLILR